MNSLTRVLSVSGLLLIFTSSGFSQERLLGEANWRGTRPPLLFPSGESVFLTYGLLDDLALFDTRQWSEDDVGSTHSAIPGSDPSFRRLADMLVDGQDSYIQRSVRTSTGGGGGSGSKESIILNAFVPTTAIDLQGYEVTRIELTLAALDSVPPMQWGFEPEFRFYGLSEPSTLSLCPWLLLGIAMSRRRSKLSGVTS